LATSKAFLDTELLRLVTAGSVDDGKSTLIGRLLLDTKLLLSDQLDAVSREGDGPDLAAISATTSSSAVAVERTAPVQDMSPTVRYRTLSMNGFSPSTSCTNGETA